MKTDVDIEYSGWGPCVHSKEEKVAFAGWLKGIIPERLQGTDYPESVGGLLEHLIWELNIMGASVTLVADQWTGCQAEGPIRDKKVKTFIQGDTFLISVAETYRWWRAKHKELTGVDPEEGA